MTRVALATSMDELPASDKALAESLVALGFDVRAENWSGPQEVWRKFDAVIVRSCWDYHLRIAEFLDWITFLQQNGIAIVNSTELIRWNSDKKYLGELSAAGIATPETIFLEEGQSLDLAKVCSERNWPAAVLKPRISASAYRTERKSSGVVRGPGMVQPYVAAVENFGEWSLMYFGRKFSHAVIKKPRERDFRVQKEFGGPAELAPAPESTLEFADAVLSRLAWPPLFARVDVIAEDKRILLMELEVIEPELFLDLAPGSADFLASVIADHLHSLSGNHSRSSGR